MTVQTEILSKETRFSQTNNLENHSSPFVKSGGRNVEVYPLTLNLEERFQKLSLNGENILKIINVIKPYVELDWLNVNDHLCFVVVLLPFLLYLFCAYEQKLQLK